MANLMTEEQARHTALQRKTLAGGRPLKRRPCKHCKVLFGARELQVHTNRCNARERQRAAKFSEGRSDEIPFNHKVAPAAITISIRQHGSNAYCFLRVHDQKAKMDKWIGPEIVKVVIGFDADHLAAIALARGIEELSPGHEWLSIFTDNDTLISRLRQGRRVYPVSKDDLSPILRHEGGKVIEYESEWRAIMLGAGARGPDKHTSISFVLPNNDVRYYDETMSYIDNFLHARAS